MRRSEAVAQPQIDESVRGVPAPALRPFIAWYSGYRQAGLAPGRHRGLPSPYLTVIFTLDDPLVIAGHPDPRQPPGSYRTLVGGLHTSPALVTHQGRQSGIQLQLSPLGARALLGTPAGELAGIDVDGPAVLGALADQIVEQMREEPDWPGRFAVVDRMLTARLDRPGPRVSPRVSPEVGQAWRLLLAAGGLHNVAALAAETGWSDRHLRSRFREETGLTPKAAARVIRFDRARRRLQALATSGEQPSLASLAADYGYYDQAHLAREYRELAGCAPSAWLAEEFAELAPQAVVEGGGPPRPTKGRVPKRPSRARRRGARLAVMNDKTPPPQVWPTLRARDARGLIRFLVDAFGFEETVVYGEGDRVDHAQLSWPAGGGIMLGSVREEAAEDAWPLRPGTFGAYVVTDDPDGLFSRATAAGAHVLRELHDTDYGSRDFAVTDPEGNHWSFGTYRGEPRAS